MKINSKTQYIIPAIKVVSVRARRVMAGSDPSLTSTSPFGYIYGDENDIDQIDD